METATARAGVLPFRIVESLGVGCGYERSFKLAAGRILANRYLLGVETRQLTAAQLLTICRRLAMPAPLRDQFQAGLADANLVLLGFEDSEQHGCLYKVYLEYWERLRTRLRQGLAPGERHLLHQGFKWYIDAPAKQLVSRYECLPGLGGADIQARIEAIYAALPQAAGLEASRRMLAAARRRRPRRQLLYVEVSETGNARRSFDLNLYPAELRVRQVAALVRQVAAALAVPGDRLERLLAMIPDQRLGHLSAGIARSGDEYLSVYYER